MRAERDSLGEVLVPDDVLYGASTERARLNFPVSGHHMPLAMIAAVARLKRAAAAANEHLGRLDADRSRWIQQAATEIIDGQLDTHFPLDVFQTGSGTSTNTNVNEVIANRVSQLTGRPLGSRDPVHPNDHVNLGQSSNDVMPSALHISVALELRGRLRPALSALASALEDNARAFTAIVKIGRTHLMDATPITLGQEMSGYAAQIRKAEGRVDRAIEVLLELAIGGTAVGTGLNTHPEFAARVGARIAEETGLAFREAPNHFEAQGARDDVAEVAGVLSAVAGALTKIANDIRLLGSGPRAGLAELRLPSTQPGSSIMPGKVNPVMCEMLVQVGHYVHGLAQSATLAARDGHLELNVTIPLLAHVLHEAIVCLANGTRLFTERCIHGLEADMDRCAELVERSLMLVTALTPAIGYDEAARVAKEAHATGRTLREVVLARGLLTADEVDRLLDPVQMLGPR